MIPKFMCRHNGNVRVDEELLTEGDIQVNVEIQAQHRPDRLKKPRTESVGTDRLGRVPSRLGPIE